MGNVDEESVDDRANKVSGAKWALGKERWVWIEDGERILTFV